MSKHRKYTAEIKNSRRVSHLVSAYSWPNLLTEGQRTDGPYTRSVWTDETGLQAVFIGLDRPCVRGLTDTNDGTLFLTMNPTMGLYFSH